MPAIADKVLSYESSPLPALPAACDVPALGHSRAWPAPTKSRRYSISNNPCRIGPTDNRWRTSSSMRGSSGWYSLTWR